MKSILLLGAGLLAACRASGPPYSSKEALGAERGWRIEPFAAEPAVVSPVALDIDENGNIYVVEDRGYPLNIAGKLGRAKLLRDTDGDGIPDRRDHEAHPTFARAALLAAQGLEGHV